MTTNRTNTGQFQKGHKTWNKDLKGIHLSPASEFKKGGLVGDRHHSWAGGVQHNKVDCTYLHDGCNKRVRRPRRVYETHKGRIPPGFVVSHKDGDRYNDSPDNLEAISRAENMRRNAPNHN